MTQVHVPQQHHHHHYHHNTHHIHRRFGVLVMLTGLLVWTWIYDTSQTSLLNPRKLMAEGDEMSTGRTTAMAGGAVATLLRHPMNYSQRDPVVSIGLVEVPVDVDLVQANISDGLDNNKVDKDAKTTWNHVVYLVKGAEESWRSRPSRNYTVVVEPRTGAPGDFQDMNQDDDDDDDDDDDETSPGEPLGGDDPIRWYPQIDSNDERFHIERKGWPRHEIHPERCHPMHPWQSANFPNCNTIHETNLGRSLVEQNLYMISKKGFWRHAWGSYDGADRITTTALGNQTLRRKMVWKTFKINHGMEDAFFENNRVDALAMERLTASPHIIDIYGFCGMTVVQEYAGGQLHELKLNSMEKLDLAIGLAQGIRDIHHIDNSKLPAMAHNDINLANIIVTDDGRPVLNDFNIAVLLMKDDSYDEEGKACPFYGRFPNPQWRSPEEQVDSEEESKNNPPVVNEKIDIYAMGNVLFRLVAGVSPWKKEGQSRLTAEDKIEAALAKRYNGTLPELPSDVDLDNPVMVVLNEAMQMCYRFDPDKRPSAIELVTFLETARTNLVAKMGEKEKKNKMHK